jgi:hypothetical protein
MFYSLRRRLHASPERSCLQANRQAKRRPATCRPGVELLENRIVPALGVQEVYDFQGAANDVFGTVAIDQNTAVIGAPGHSSSEGAAYIYTRTGGEWNQQQELTAPDAAANDTFGSSVAVSGNTLVIGAPKHQVGSNASQGTSYIYVLSGSTWILQKELTAADGVAGDQFGSSVSINGNTLVVAAPGRQVGSNSQQGAAYVFTRAGSAWTQQGPDLVSGDGLGSDGFGSAVAVKGSTVVIGAADHPVSGTLVQGAVYVFGLQGGAWTQEQELTVSGTFSFGKSVAVDGNTIVVGASGTLIGSHTFQGAAYVFALAGGSWTEQQQLTSQDGASSDNFGDSVAISGGTILIGAPSHQQVNQIDLPTGAGYLFVRNGGLWTQQEELTGALQSPGGTATDGFGTSVGLSGNTAVIGAPNADPLYHAQQGAATFLLTGQQEVTAADGAANDGFGQSVAIDGNTAVIGAG